jgi:hypothetical protein
MGSLSSFMQDELLDHLFKTGSYTAPTNIYVALCTGTPDAADTGSTFPGEITGTGALARIKCNTWDAATGDPGATENSQTVSFAQATGDMGTVTHFALADKTTLGNAIGWGALSASRTISSGDTASFSTGSLDVTLT